MKEVTLISTRNLKEILATAIVYAAYIAENHESAPVKNGAKFFAADCEKQLAELK